MIHILIFFGAFYLFGIIITLTENLHPRWPLHRFRWFNWVADQWAKFDKRP